MKIPIKDNEQHLPFYDKEGILNIYNAVDKSDTLKLKKNESINTSEIRSIEKYKNAKGAFKMGSKEDHYQSILNFISN